MDASDVRLSNQAEWMMRGAWPVRAEVVGYKPVTDAEMKEIVDAGFAVKEACRIMGTSWRLTPAGLEYLKAMRSRLAS